MTTLVLKDLPHFDELDRAAALSVRGGTACFTPEPPVSCHGGFIPDAPVYRGWGGCPPVHYGCAPKVEPYGSWGCQPARVVTPL
jgi:hypothetical protein